MCVCVCVCACVCVCVCVAYRDLLSSSIHPPLSFFLCFLQPTEKKPRLQEEEGRKKVRRSNSPPVVKPIQLQQLCDLPPELLPAHQEYIMKQVHNVIRLRDMAVEGLQSGESCFWAAAKMLAMTNHVTFHTVVDINIIL